MGEVPGSTKKRVSIWWAISSTPCRGSNEQAESTKKRIALVAVVLLVVAAGFSTAQEQYRRAGREKRLLRETDHGADERTVLTELADVGE